ncbi:MAG TPA: hypothetical protein VG096_06660 [Bryobacteraceae bacterium]|nr:hypothetical protein [Bryobacteraceae bacterium]
MRYRTPTDPGSSENSVFNWRWEVAGLNHAGSHSTQRLHVHGAYEGITMRAIRRKLGAV